MMPFLAKADGVYYYRDGAWRRIHDAVAKDAPLMSRKEQKRFLEKLKNAG